MKLFASKKIESVYGYSLIPADGNKNQDEIHTDVYGQSLEATSEARDNNDNARLHDGDIKETYAVAPRRRGRRIKVYRYGM
jgi:hypothetical protein